MATISNYDRWQEVERLRAERNAVANKMKGKLDPSVRQALVEEGRISISFFFVKKSSRKINDSPLYLFLVLFAYFEFLQART